MEKMKMETPNLTEQNIEKIAELFPNCITETKIGGGYQKAINFNLLKQMLSDSIVEGKEVYEFTWPGKKEAIIEANTPIRKTLRPCKEESKNWDTTENLYIEGDNLDVLKLLQESYLGKVKMIYIDPPYNTGHDFIYRDNFREDINTYERDSSIKDSDNNRLIVNSSSEGRFHSNWCSMIYPRLLLTRNLLSDDGSIFISIDDSEQENLKKICDEIFGAENFVAQINWKGRGGRQDSKYFAAVHEYIFCYAKNISNFVAGEDIKSGDVYPKYDSQRKRYYKTQLLRKWGSNSRRIDRPNLFYPITAPDGSLVYPMLKGIYSESNLENFGCWRHGKETMMKNIQDGKVEFVKQNNGTWIAYEKIFAPLEGEEKTKKYSTWIEEPNDGLKVVKSLFNAPVFDYPKGPSIIQKFLKMASTGTDEIIMDFFSGSATTAQAILEENALDNQRRKFIMVQLPELSDIKSEAQRAGYKNICEIGKERIRRAGEKIKSEHPEAKNLDIGFRVLKVDSSNMNDVYYTPDDYSQGLLDHFESNIKEDRSSLDLLFGCLLDWGLPLSLPYTSEKIDGFTVHNYNDGDLIACFDENISDSVIKEIAKRQPLRVVFRDSSFESNPSKINVSEIFKMISPDTTVKVI